MRLQLTIFAALAATNYVNAICTGAGGDDDECRQRESMGTGGEVVPDLDDIPVTPADTDGGYLDSPDFGRGDNSDDGGDVDSRLDSGWTGDVNGYDDGSNDGSNGGGSDDDSDNDDSGYGDNLRDGIR